MLTFLNNAETRNFFIAARKRKSRIQFRASTLSYSQYGFIPGARYRCRLPLCQH